MKCIERKEGGIPIMLFRIVFVTDAMMSLLGREPGIPKWKVTKTLCGKNKRDIIREWKSIRNTREEWWI